MSKRSCYFFTNLPSLPFQIPNAEMLHDDTGEYDRARAQNKMRTFLGTNREFDCVFANNDEMAIGCVPAMRSMRKSWLRFCRSLRTTWKILDKRSIYLLNMNDLRHSQTTLERLSQDKDSLFRSCRQLKRRLLVGVAS
ncbi:MAG: hypothetical protein ACOX2M_09260 [Fastidiosipilaceae bacterium]